MTGAGYADVRETTGLALDDLDALIAQRAFERYQARGCQNGCDLDDWLEAEREVLSQVPPG
jgi:hypothetical protein